MTPSDEQHNEIPAKAKPEKRTWKTTIELAVQIFKPPGESQPPVSQEQPKQLQNVAAPGDGEIRKVVHKTQLDSDVLRYVTNIIKGKEEERLRHELEFKSEPGEVKPACPIDKFQPTSPCPVSWEDMSGSSRVKFCDRCSQHVYDVRNLSLEQAQELVVKMEGSSKISFYRRADGKFQIKDCPVGAEEKKQRRVKIAMAVTLVGASIGILIVAALTRPTQQVELPHTPVELPRRRAPYVVHSAGKIKAAKSVQVPIPQMQLPQSTGKAPATAVRVDIDEPPQVDGNGLSSHPYASNNFAEPTGGFARYLPQPEKQPWDD